MGPVCYVVHSVVFHLRFERRTEEESAAGSNSGKGAGLAGLHAHLAEVHFAFPPKQGPHTKPPRVSLFYRVSLAGELVTVRPVVLEAIPVVH